MKVLVTYSMHGSAPHLKLCQSLNQAEDFIAATGNTYDYRVYSLTELSFNGPSVTIGAPI